jgi:hypothetical protein
MRADEQIRSELQELGKEGEDLLEELRTAAVERQKAKTSSGKKTQSAFNLFEFSARYQNWYSTALPLVEQLLPDRYEEFHRYYRNEQRKALIWSTYTISDFLRTNTPAGISSPETIAFMSFNVQVDIVVSAMKRLESRLADIKGILQAELFDSEISAAGDLAKKGHLRAAGAVAGVVLERHLAKLAIDHNVKVRKAHPTIGDLNDPLKNAEIYDVPTWRKIQHLADIRNICDHFKGREPSRDEVEELIRGADWVVKNVF